MADQILASLAPLDHHVSVDGIDFQSYYIPDQGNYLILRKDGDHSYSYFNCINESAYQAAWAFPEAMLYVDQAPSNIDFSAIVLRDALQATVDSNQDVSNSITDNQERQLENQAAIRGYQLSTANNTANLLTNTQLRASALHVVVDNPSASATTVNVGNFPSSQHVTVDNPITAVSISNFPATVTSIQVSNFPVTQAVTGSFYPATQPVSIASMPTTPVSGTFWQGVQPISGTVTISNPVSTVSVSSLPAGLATTSNQLIANTSLASIDSKLTSPLSVKILPSTTGGLSGKVVTVNAAGTTATVVKATAGQLYDVIASNNSLSVVYLSLFNKATAPVATDIPVAIYAVQAGGSIQYSFPLGNAFSVGIAFTVTSNITILGVLTGLLAASQVIINCEYA